MIQYTHKDLGTRIVGKDWCYRGNTCYCIVFNTHSTLYCFALYVCGYLCVYYVLYYLGICTIISSCCFSTIYPFKHVTKAYAHFIICKFSIYETLSYYSCNISGIKQHRLYATLEYCIHPICIEQKKHSHTVHNSTYAGK